MKNRFYQKKAKPNSTEKTVFSHFSSENVNLALYAFENYGSPHLNFAYQCTNALCLKNSEFASFCYFCGAKPLIKLEKGGASKKPKNGRFAVLAAADLNMNADLDKIGKFGGECSLREELILKSLDLILRLLEKNANSKSVKRNGGDVLFLLRNLYLNVVCGGRVEVFLVFCVFGFKGAKLIELPNFVKDKIMFKTANYKTLAKKDKGN